MHTEEIQYQDGDVTLHGFIAYDESTQEPRPGVLVSHDWSGRNEFACEKAQKLAELGYVGFALDMYGEGKLGKDNDEKGALIGPLVSDRTKLQQRIMTALQALHEFDVVDKSRIGAIGFCFGGLCVLDLARSGADIKGVVSFHGLLHAPENVPNKTIKAKVLALHGHDDPMVPPEQVLAFEQEMSAGKVDWQVHAYGNTVHAFTNPVANDPDFGTVYDATADERSWIAMKNFFAEIF